MFPISVFHIYAFIVILVQACFVVHSLKTDDNDTKQRIVSMFALGFISTLCYIAMTIVYREALMLFIPRVQ